MPYKTYTTTAVEKLIKEFVEIDKNYKSIEKSKSTKDIESKKTFVKNMNLKGLEIGRLLKADMQGINTNYTTHVAKLNTLLNSSNQSVTEAKQALKLPSKESLNKLVECYNDCAKWQDDASTDALEFGKAWSAHRSYNDINKIPEEWGDEFRKARAVLMATQKTGSNILVDKIEHNATVVEGLIKQARGTQRKTIVEIRAEAKNLEQRLTALVNADKKLAQTALDQKLLTLSRGAKAKDDTASMDFYESSVEDIKGMKIKAEQRAAAMKSLYDGTYTSLKGFEADPEVKTYIEKSKVMLLDMHKLRNALIKGEVDAQNHLETIIKNRQQKK